MLESLPSGTVLQGHYRIERALGSGGFGHVYLAIDMGTGQHHAIKEYLVTGPSGQEQLMHEANVLGQLHHPNLPAFQDAFNERGRYYVVLNYIEGNDLTDIIRVARQRNEVVPIARVMEWLLAICDAVIFLHSQRPAVIHRDIKPDNIRIMPNGTAILVDLGNAKAADGARTLFFIRHQGTPGYAPEEQYPGGSGTDVRSDVYALGGTLYFALTAHEPPSVSARKQSMQQGQRDLPSLQEQLANNPPEESPEANAARQFRLGVTKPSKPAPRHSRHIAQLGTVPPEMLTQLDRIIYRAMAMRPKDRYQSVTELSHDLRQAMQALPSTQTRQPDLNNTQPDLPELYERLQAAKSSSPPDIADVNTAPMPPEANTCPRCSASLLPQAAFCPQCGTPTNRATPPVTGTSMSSPRASTTQAQAKDAQVKDPQASGASLSAGISQSQRGSIRTITGEQTVRIPPQARGFMQSLQTQLPVASSTPSHSISAYSISGQSNAAPASTSLVSQAITTRDDVLTQGQHIPPAQVKNTTTTRSGFHLEPRTILFLAIIILALLVIIALFVINQGHHGHAEKIEEIFRFSA